MLEGSREFDIIWGTAFGCTCFAIGFTVVWDWLVLRRTNGPSMFGASTDPGRGLQLAWGIFTLAMGGTNFGCRYVEHRYLLDVHEGFFGLTLLAIAVTLPRLPIVRRLFLRNRFASHVGR